MAADSTLTKLTTLTTLREEIGAERPWLTLKQGAAYAGPKRSPRLLAREIHAGRLRAARVGGRAEYVLRREWIDAWLEGLARPVMVAPRRA